MEDGGILVVDDDRGILCLVRDRFRQAGIRVQCVENGEEALLKIQESSIVLMLTDLNMPGMNGLELARRARELAPDLRIVMCTASLSPEINELASRAGIAKVLGKPFIFPEILALARCYGEMGRVVKAAPTSS